MKWIDIYLCVIGTALLRFIIADNSLYLFSCVMLGLGLGIWRGLQK